MASGDFYQDVALLCNYAGCDYESARSALARCGGDVQAASALLQEASSAHHYGQQPFGRYPGQGGLAQQGPWTDASGGGNQRPMLVPPPPQHAPQIPPHIPKFLYRPEDADQYWAHDPSYMMDQQSQAARGNGNWGPDNARNREDYARRQGSRYPSRPDSRSYPSGQPGQPGTERDARPNPNPRPPPPPPSGWSQASSSRARGENFSKGRGKAGVSASQAYNNSGLEYENGRLILPSVGSAGHLTKTCRPCHYIRTKNGCANDYNCSFCHCRHTKRSRPKLPLPQQRQCRALALMVFEAQSKGEEARKRAEEQLLVQTSGDIRLAAYTTSVLRSLRGGAKLQEGKLSGGQDDEEEDEEDDEEDEEDELDEQEEDAQKQPGENAQTAEQQSGEDPATAEAPAALVSSPEGVPEAESKDAKEPTQQSEDPALTMRL